MAGKDEPNWGRGFALGLELAVGIALGAVTGNWIDHKYKTSPWGVLVGAGLGFASGMYLLIKDAFRSDQK